MAKNEIERLCYCEVYFLRFEIRTVGIRTYLLIKQGLEWTALIDMQQWEALKTKVIFNLQSNDWLA